MKDGLPTGNSISWVWPLAGALVCLGLGTTSGLIVAGGDDTWYQSLVKPPGQPPPWIFGPVWSVLYILIGIAGGRLIQRRAWRAVRLFALQFLLNLAWTPVFFGARRIWLALAVIIGLWSLLLLLMNLARRADPWSMLLLIPYLAWVSYAIYLNSAIAWLNR